MMNDHQLLAHAADLLDADALELRKSHNVNHLNPEWQNEPEAKAAHDDCRATATRLLDLAGRLSVWTPVAEQLPDSDMTVMLFDPTSDEPVWPGYHDGEAWKSAEGMPATPTHWTEMPEGPGEKA